MTGRNLTFAIGDLHGRFDLLTQALAAIERHAPPDGGTRRVVFLGDYIDRGPRSRQILDCLMAGPPADWDWVMLMGNHEALMRDAVSNRASIDHWLDNGGEATLQSFGELASTRPHFLATVAWAARLPLWFADTHRLFVHAGAVPGLPLEQHREATLLWDRNTGTEPHEGRHVVHGHTPQTSGRPLLLPGRTNLDTFAFKTGRLAVGVFDDAVPGGPLGIIDIVGGAEREM